MTPLLELENLEVVYHHVATAIQGVSLRVPPGSIVALPLASTLNRIAAS